MQPKIVRAKSLKENLTPERCYISENYGASTGDKQVSIAHARVEPGVITKVHHLEGAQEIYLIIEGKGKIYIGNTEPTEVGKGDVITIPPGTSQKIVNTGKTDLVFYYICTPAFTQECYRSDETKKLRDDSNALVQGLTGLIDPLKVRGVTLRNRIVMPPMQSGRATFEGAVTNRLINFYVKRSSALGLVIVEHAYVSLQGKLSPKQLGIYDDALVEGFEKLAKAIHAVGTPVVLQITHAGAVGNKQVINADPVGPSATGKARELQKNELDGVAEEFALAAMRAVEAGFDGVELHGAHGYLLNQFFSPLFNKREDEFGGSLDNRMRFPLLVVEKVRGRIEDKLLLYRLGADDLAPNGTQIEDSAVFAKKLEQSGVDAIDVSGGMCGSDPKQLRRVKGYFVPQASMIKKAVNIPVIGVGRIREAEYADRLVRDGEVDLVAVGRALWADPEWAGKAVEKLQMGKGG